VLVGLQTLANQDFSVSLRGFESQKWLRKFHVSICADLSAIELIDAFITLFCKAISGFTKSITLEGKSCIISAIRAAHIAY